LQLRPVCRVQNLNRSVHHSPAKRYVRGCSFPFRLVGGLVIISQNSELGVFFELLHWCGHALDSRPQTAKTILASSAGVISSLHTRLQLTIKPIISVVLSMVLVHTTTSALPLPTSEILRLMYKQWGRQAAGPGMWVRIMISTHVSVSQKRHKY